MANMLDTNIKLDGKRGYLWRIWATEEAYTVCRHATYDENGIEIEPIERFGFFGLDVTPAIDLIDCLGYEGGGKLTDPWLVMTAEETLPKLIEGWKSVQVFDLYSGDLIGTATTNDYMVVRSMGNCYDLVTL